MKRYLMILMTMAFASLGAACGGLDPSQLEGQAWEEHEIGQTENGLTTSVVIVRNPSIDDYPICTEMGNRCRIRGGCTLDPFAGGWGYCPPDVEVECRFQEMTCVDLFGPHGTFDPEVPKP